MREQQRLAQQQAEREAATRAAQEAQANQIASENLIVAQYAGIIRKIISQNWQIPPSARNGMSAMVRLQLVPTGEMVAVNIVQSSGNDVFDRSVLQAVERADRFPELQDLDNAVFERNFRRAKQDITELSDVETRVAVAAKGLLRKFKWRDAVASKGDDARTHFGIIAQDLQDAFTAEGLDAGRYAMFINSTWTDEETGEERSRMGVRYSELLAFIIAAI